MVSGLTAIISTIMRSYTLFSTKRKMDIFRSFYFLKKESLSWVNNAFLHGFFSPEELL